MATQTKIDGMEEAQDQLAGIEGKCIQRVEVVRPEHAHPHDSPWELKFHLDDGTTLHVESYLSPALCSRPPTLQIARRTP